MKFSVPTLNSIHWRGIASDFVRVRGPNISKHCFTLYFVNLRYIGALRPTVRESSSAHHSPRERVILQPGFILPYHVSICWYISLRPHRLKQTNDNGVTHPKHVTLDVETEKGTT